MYAAQEGSTQTVKAEPTRVGHEFAGWTVAGLDGVTTLESGVSFSMPDNNVTFTATWNELPACKVKYLEKGTDKELSPFDTLYGHAGDVVTADAKDDIEGYHLADPTQASGKATLVEGETPEIVFYYEKDAANYQVNYYLNGTEQKVADTETLSAPWGSEVAASDLAKGINGYRGVWSSGNRNCRARRQHRHQRLLQNADAAANSAAREYTGEQKVSKPHLRCCGGLVRGHRTSWWQKARRGQLSLCLCQGAVGTVSADGSTSLRKRMTASL